jgi:Na+-transporting methylmalonyl-CoA/oxaloacetate decarboxylase gamma subunit
MEDLARVLSEGDAVFLTVLGMGCVFLALIALDFFMSFMDRIVGGLALPVRLLARWTGRATSRTQAVEAAQSPGGDAALAATGAASAAASGATPDADPAAGAADAEIAAAISVALALHAGGGSDTLSLSPASPAKGISPWKIGGRLRQLQRVPGR